MIDPHLPWEAEIVNRVEESPTIFTLRMRFTDEHKRRTYHFAPGQFNMLYLYGVAEVPISIVSDPRDESVFDHTIRKVGRVTRAIEKLKVGDRIGIRGPYGRGWPLKEAEGHDVIVVTGGLGCAPVVAAINYILMRRERFGHLTIIQGVKRTEEVIWRERYDYWNTLPDVAVFFGLGRATIYEGMKQAKLRPGRTIAMMCGPETMMNDGVKHLTARGVEEDHIYLSMERNMQCGLGLCGHCQHGSNYVCREGPVFAYPRLKELFHTKGY